MGPLRNAKKGNISAEQARRIDQLLTQLERPVPGREQLREIRAVATLEQIGGAEIQKALSRLAASVAGTRVTEESKASLHRLQRSAR